MHISKLAGIEKSTVGVGVSSSVRRYWRNYYTQKRLPQMLGPNAQLNTMIAGDFKGAQPIHRFILKSGEVGEIRKSHDFYYVAAIRSAGQYDVIVIQPRFKEAPQEISKRRLTPEWLSSRKTK